MVSATKSNPGTKNCRSGRQMLRIAMRLNMSDGGGDLEHNLDNISVTGISRRRNYSAAREVHWRKISIPLMFRSCGTRKTGSELSVDVFCGKVDADSLDSSSSSSSLTSWSNALGSFSNAMRLHNSFMRSCSSR